MATRKLSVLGGGSPFTLALLDVLAGAPDGLAISQLSLHGRSPDSLRDVAAYARRRLAPLGWTVSHTTRLEESLQDSAFVVQQIRFGGLEGRAADEEAARACGLAPDETLGPAAMHSVLRTAADVRALGRAIARAAPDAWVLNLSNPLGITTALLEREGVARCLGVCELPMTTAARLAALLGHDASELTWEYAGLNHRGFLVNVRLRGEDAWPRIADRLRGGDLAAVPAGVLDRLRAVPTKYFRQVLEPAPPPSDSRAGALSALRHRILEELRRWPDRRPPGLAERQMDWYDAALVPLLRALCRRADSRLVVNRTTPAGIVEERLARVGRSGVRLEPAPAVSPEVHRWLETFRAHEHAVLAMALDPTPSRVAAAIRADPAVPPGARERVFDVILRRPARP